MKYVISLLMAIVINPVLADEKIYSGTCSENKPLTNQIFDDFDNAMACKDDKVFDKEFDRVLKTYPEYKASELHAIMRENSFAVKEKIGEQDYFLKARLRRVVATNDGEMYVINNGDNNKYADSRVYTMSAAFDLRYKDTLFGKVSRSVRSDTLPKFKEGDILTFICPGIVPEPFGQLTEIYKGCLLFQ